MSIITTEPFNLEHTVKRLPEGFRKLRYGESIEQPHVYFWSVYYDAERNDTTDINLWLQDTQDNINTWRATHHNDKGQAVYVPDRACFIVRYTKTPKGNYQI